jgi:FADH2 O2-dependent halogenase
MFLVALRYGCEARQNTRVEDVEFDDDGATLTIVGGEQVRARYVVDASGFRSVVANKLGLRDDPCRFKHHARSIFTHMIGVKPTDEVLHHSPKDQPPVPWHEGTMHHLFKRGWFWVIPFNNNKESRNPLCSVGVTLDERTYPKPTNLTPEQEFYQIASRFPAVARQFADARATRAWVSTDRLQYSSRRVVGERWCLLSHAAGFLDPLFSRGLSNSCEVINVLAWRLLQSFKDDEFTADRFDYVDEMQQRLLDYNDDIVNCAYISFDDYDLWNAVFRIWGYGSVPGTVRIHNAIQKFRRTRDDQVFRDLEEAPNLGLWWPDHKGYAEMFSLMVETCEAYERGELSSTAAANRLHRELEEADWVAKGVGFNDRNERFLNPTPPKLIKMVKWLATDAPPEMRELALTTCGDAVRTFVKGKRIF